jgi:homopolymeric O-antigen transport system ATP-binding protein
MSRDIAIRASGLSKRYSLGQMASGYDMLRDVLVDRVRRRARTRPTSKEFWALQDIDLEVERGETFGIIGHNGAGKSTLLKILSRITPPTRGEADLIGRVGALLEVGTGFHPELTGRENVYLNGAILSMSRAEIARKFDEIVEFADIGQFIDTPVKRYSSGMQLRLAFAVAAHLEPEILIIDEVLSVGDLAFQQKCLGRMETVAREGRTVLFVSHNLTAVSKLCSRSMLLNGGRQIAIGDSDEVIAEYVRSVGTAAGTPLSDRDDRRGSGELRFSEISFESGGRPTDNPTTGEPFEILLRYRTKDGRRLRNVSFGVLVLTHLNELMLHLSSPVSGALLDEIPGEGVARCLVPRCPLPAGQYRMHIWAETANQPIDWIEFACELTVVQGDFFGSGKAPPPTHRAVLVDHGWTVEEDRLEAPQPAGAMPR